MFVSYIQPPLTDFHESEPLKQLRHFAWLEDGN